MGSHDHDNVWRAVATVRGDDGQRIIGETTVLADTEGDAITQATLEMSDKIKSCHEGPATVKVTVRPF